MQEFKDVFLFRREIKVGCNNKETEGNDAEK